MIELFTSPQAIFDIFVQLLTLTVLEIVLGIDNIIFLTLTVALLPKNLQNKGRYCGLAGAMLTRVLLLCSLSYLAHLTVPLFSLLGEEFDGRALVLIVGGLFLIWKSTHEIHGSLQDEDEEVSGAIGTNFWYVIGQIALLDIVFSLDSVITAVGMVDHVPVMIAAVILAVAIMMFAAKTIGDFVTDNPTVKMLALAFLVMIGMSLVAEGMGHEVSKGYIYAAMAFASGVEILNIKKSKKKLA